MTSYSSLTQKRLNCEIYITHCLAQMYISPAVALFRPPNILYFAIAPFMLTASVLLWKRNVFYYQKCSTYPLTRVNIEKSPTTRVLFIVQFGVLLETHWRWMVDINVNFPLYTLRFYFLFKFCVAIYLSDFCLLNWLFSV